MLKREIVVIDIKISNKRNKTVGEKRRMIDNKVITVSNYATEELQRTLDTATQAGYKLVNVVLAPNKYGVKVMYLFFVMEVK